MMTLHPQWRQILTRAWSMWGNYTVAILSGIEAASTYAADGRLGAAAGIFLTSIVSSGARIVQQKSLSGDE